MKDIKLGQDFGRALCKHFNLPAGQTCNLKIDTDFGEIFGATVTIHFKPADLAAIGSLMEQDVLGKHDVVAAAPVDPLLAEVKRTNDLLQRMLMQGECTEMIRESRLDIQAARKP